MTCEAALPHCYHCGLEVITGDKFSDVIDGARQLFCCPACKTIASTIIDSGMQSFYQFRTGAESAPSEEILSASFDAFDDPQFQQQLASFSTDNQGERIATVNLLVGGVHCAACVWLLENYLQRATGVRSMQVSLNEHKATLTWYADQTRLSTLCQLIARLGYQPEPYTPSKFQAMQRRENRQALRRLGVAGIAMMQVGMFAIALYAGGMKSIAIEYRDFIRWVSLIVTTPVVFYSAVPFFTGAWRGLKLAKPGMDLPVAIAIALAYVASTIATVSGSGEVYFDSVTMFTFLLLGGRYLEMRARHFSGKLNANDLNSLLPSTTILLSNNASTQQSVPLFKVKPGDVILIKAGQVVPVDGCVIDGSSGVNESQLTGEFMLQRKTVGDHVLAGSVNGDGALTVRVQATGAQLQLQTINQLLGQAHVQKPLIAQWADRLASVFVVAVLLLSVVTYWIWHYIDSADAFWIMLSVLVISCPCALSLATPAALAAATSRLRRLGLLVTRAQVWQRMAKVTHVVCDKTGTLTQGKLTIVGVQCHGSLSQSQCLEIATALEMHSEHPIASAFDQPRVLRAPATNVKVVTGKGLEGTIAGKVYRIGTAAYTCGLYGGSVNALPTQPGQRIFLSDQHSMLCSIELQDTLRESAQVLVRTLQHQGLQVHMLSGDSRENAEQLSARLGLDHCVANASPEQKLAYIRQLQADGACVLMLGDGINDIPVLAVADVSVAMCHASNLAKTHADCILLSNTLRTVLTLFDVTAKTRRIIKQNLAWALTYNTLALPLAASAMIAPYIAALGMSLSSLVVMFNALRLQWMHVGASISRGSHEENRLNIAYAQSVGEQ